MSAVHLPQLLTSLAAWISYTSINSCLFKILRGIQVPHDRLLPELVKTMTHPAHYRVRHIRENWAGTFCFLILATHFALFIFAHSTLRIELHQGIDELNIQPVWLLTGAKQLYLQSISVLQVFPELRHHFIDTSQKMALVGMTAIKLVSFVFST